LQETLLLYRPLVWIGRTIDFDQDRSLAAAVHAADGNTRFHITLKPWFWSDGVPLTSDDVLFGWQRILALGAIYPFAGQGGIPDNVAAVQPTGPLSLDIELKSPVNPEWFTLNALSLLYALPRHAWGNPNADEMWNTRNNPAYFRVVDGPFRLAELQPDRYVAFEPNPMYGGHRAALRRLVIVFLEGANALHELQAGEIDMARVPSNLWQRVAHTPGLHEITLPEPFGYWSLIFNQRGPATFLRDARIRRALAAAVNQQDIIRLAYAGHGTENHAPAPSAPAIWRSPGPADPAMRVRYDPAAAAAALDQAGWRIGPDGIRQKHGERLTFTLVTDADPDHPEMQALLVVQANLRAAGVDMRISAVSPARKLDLMFGGGTDWDAISVPVTTNPLPDGLGTWNTGGANNFGAFSDARMDALITRSITEPGRQALFDYRDYAELQQPALFLPQVNQLVLVSNRLHGVEEFANAVGFWSPEYLSVDDPACRAPGHALP
jgi:peptide/nickel transport system substrate-binding protein